MDIKKLKEELIRDECRGGKPELRPYLDSAVPPRLTIGIGHNLTDGGISEDVAGLMFQEDVGRAMGKLDAYAPWWRRLDEVRQRVMLNMTFNMGFAPDAPPGRGGLAEFHHMLAATEAGDYSGAADEMLNSKWAKQVGARATRLSDMMRKGTP